VRTLAIIGLLVYPAGIALPRFLSLGSLALISSKKSLPERSIKLCSKITCANRTFEFHKGVGSFLKFQMHHWFENLDNKLRALQQSDTKQAADATDAEN